MTKIGPITAEASCQFAEMKREIQKLSRRQESPTAAISRPASPENRGRRVMFADDGQTSMRRERSRERYFPKGQRTDVKAMCY